MQVKRGPRSRCKASAMEFSRAASHGSYPFEAWMALAPVSSRRAVENFRRRSSAQHEMAARDCRSALRGFHAATSAMRRPCGIAGRLVVEDVDGKERCARLRRGGQRGIVGKPKVAAEPDDDGRLLFRHASVVWRRGGKRRLVQFVGARGRSSRTRRVRSMDAAASVSRTVRTAMKAARSGGKP